MVRKRYCDVCDDELFNDDYWRIEDKRTLKTEELCSKCFKENYENFLIESKYCIWGEL